MIVYQTDYDGTYIGPVQADSDPLDPGNWLIPGGCVETKPPELGPDEITHWTGSEWVISVVVPEPEPEPEPEPTEEELRIAFRDHAYLSKTNFCMALWKMGIIPANEAKQAAKGNWPDSFAAALTALPPDEQVAAEIEWAGSANVLRKHHLIDYLSIAADLSPEQLDIMFGYTVTARLGPPAECVSRMLRDVSNDVIIDVSNVVGVACAVKFLDLSVDVDGAMTRSSRS